MKKTLTIILFFWFSNTLFSQYIKFEGTVIDETSESVENATVVIEKTTFSKTTNRNGKFLFEEEIVSGKYIVSVSKVGFVTKFFVIQVEDQKNIVVDKIIIDLTRNEKRRRWKNKKVREEEERRIKRERKKVGAIIEEKKENNVEETKPKEKIILQENVKKQEEIVVITKETLLKEKYARKLNIEPESITNMQLYEFIEKWERVPYLSRGTTREGGIDASSFAKQLYDAIFDKYIANTIIKQFNSESIDKFTDVNAMQEGDLVFFHGLGQNKGKVIHVGVYLSNNRFVHATSRLGVGGRNGVKISDLREAYWKKRYLCGARE